LWATSNQEALYENPAIAHRHYCRRDMWDSVADLGKATTEDLMKKSKEAFDKATSGKKKG
jgi:ribosome recycling factor